MSLTVVGKPRVLSFLSQSQQSLLPADYLASFEVISLSLDDTGIDELGDDFDFALLDLEILIQHSDKLANWRSRHQPLQLPTLVIVPSEGSDHLPSEMLEHVDAFVLEPVKASELSVSIATLLKVRRLSYELHQQQTQLTEATRLKSRFISAIAHEFRNPLSVISAVTQLLQKRDSRLSAQRKQDLLERIQTAVNRLNGMMNGLLTFNRNLSQQATFSPKTVDLKAHCQAILTDFALVDEGAAQIAFCVEGNLSEVCVDVELFRTVLKNLLSNALKYSPKGSPISIKLNSQEKQIVLQVADSGQGIPEEDLPSLFDAFFRARNAKAVEGTGLGLSIVKQCVDLYRGTIDVQSQVGKGTTFTVVLPVALPTIDQRPLFASPARIASRIQGISHGSPVKMDMQKRRQE